MPLLRKKVFERAGNDERFLRDDEEVFHCTATNEIFRNYEEFCERIILVNSMVWSCSMTGKANLTYAEALQSEENARKNIKDFPMELYIPLLYLANQTKRSAFGEMAEDVFVYMKDRYFIGEIVEASFSGNGWLESHVLQVIAPSEGQIKAAVKNGKTNERQFHPASSLYRYEIEQLDADDEDVSQIMIVDYSQIKRKKGQYSKDKSKLFLKQFVELNDSGIWIVKESALQKYGIHKVKFDQIFDGPLPDFDQSKKRIKGKAAAGPVRGVAKGAAKALTNGKKAARQDTLSKFLEKNNLTAADSKTRKNLLEEMRKKEEAFKQRCVEAKQRKAEEKMLEKQKRREENVKMQLFLKDWNKPKEDLELEDQRKLPEPFPVNNRVPTKYFGDALMVVEFVDTFSKLLSTKDFFPHGLTLELMERALIEKEVAGPLTDIVQMLLTAIFNCQDEETLQYKTDLENQSDIKEDDVAETLSLSEATHLATLASKWSNTYQGIPLGRLPMYPLTASEILRLHLLGSGARINETGAKWRYQQRGGFTSEDDPGLNLRVRQPHILKALSMYNITELSMGDKLKILSCLINQLLTFADVRDVIEERQETTRLVKVEMRALQAAEKKREQELCSTRVRLKREGKEDGEALAKELDKLERDAHDKRLDFEDKNLKLTKASTKNQVYLGLDRALQRYIKLESVPGFFVSTEEDHPGVCLEGTVAQNPELVDVQGTADVLIHIRRLFDEINSSDKENKPSTPKKVNGWRNSLKDDVNTAIDLNICTADPDNCPVHSMKNVPKWGFYPGEEHIEKLIEALNRRGIRENELRNVLQIEKEQLMKLVANTPINSLNPSLADTNPEDEKPKTRTKKSRYEDANLGYPIDMDTSEVLHLQLVDNILEMEEKICAGNLGHLKVRDRDLWRTNLTERNYRDLELTLAKKEDQVSKIKKENRESNGSGGGGGGGGSRPNTPDNGNMYRDPGRFLGVTLETESDESDMETDGVPLSHSETHNFNIKSLATALLQVAQSVDAKYLRKPLGHADASTRKKEEIDVLDRWEISLVAATSYSQIFLHYSTLDSCVMWSRSVLLARCAICRRQRDSENMLLCDSCNKGHHLYCLKPKLSAVPKGNWYCMKCAKERQAEETPQPTPRKSRRIFTENDDDEDDDENDTDNTDDDDDSKDDISMMEVCNMCGTGGQVLCCDSCPKVYHLECAQPPLRRVPRGKWLCHKCRDKKPNSSKNSIQSGQVAQRDGVHVNQRRCAAKARRKIHGFIRCLRRISVGSSNSGDDESPIQRRSNRREAEAREDLPLHNASLQELLSDIMKHKDGWPFTRPVQRNEVPDYYEVIDRPMDFGTIKYKLNMGEYKGDEDLMADAVLVFENCNTYNNSDAEVYKCGVRLLKYFSKRCKELGLKVPEELEEEDERGPTKPKKRRTL